MKSVSVLLLMVFNFGVALSQGEIADSLQQILSKKNIPDTTRVNVLIQLADFYCEVNADTSLLFTKEAKIIVDQKKIDHLLPRVLRYMAIALVVKGDYTTSTDYLQEAINSSKLDSSRFSKKEKALAYNLLGVILDYQSKTDSALHYYFKSLAIFKELNEAVGIAGRLSNIAVIHEYKSNYPLALKYFFESFQLSPDARTAQNIGRTYQIMNEPAKAKQYLWVALSLYKQDKEFDNTGVAYVNEVLGNLYSSSRQGDSAVYYLTRALHINERAKHQNGIAQVHYFFGMHYKNNERWIQARDEAEMAVNLHQLGGEKMGIAQSILLLAEVNNEMGRVEEALAGAHQGLELTKEIKAKEVQKGYLDLLASIYASQRNFKQAYSYTLQLNSLKDSINSEEKIKQVANMEALYENDKKEKELALVRAEKIIADAQLGEEETKATLLIVGLGLVTLILILGGFSYLALKKNRKALETKNEELRKLNQTKDRFFAIVGHDLRGPITSFSGINDLLNWYISKNDMEKVKAFGWKITQSVHQLDTLLNNLLNWAMSQTDAVPCRPEPLQLKQLIKECYGYFQHSLEVKDIALTDVVTDDLFVFADKNALASVLRNLLSNAIKFTPLKGEVKISAQLLDNLVCVDIRDTGVGLSEEKIKTIFALAEDKTTTGTSGEKGTGLGLLLCSDYVRLNKGTIKVASKEGEGTVFSFSIPSFQPKELQQIKQEMIHG